MSGDIRQPTFTKAHNGTVLHAALFIIIASGCRGSTYCLDISRDSLAGDDSDKLPVMFAHWHVAPSRNVACSSRISNLVGQQYVIMGNNVNNGL